MSTLALCYCSRGCLRFNSKPSSVGFRVQGGQSGACLKGLQPLHLNSITAAFTAYPCLLLVNTASTTEEPPRQSCRPLFSDSCLTHMDYVSLSLSLPVTPCGDGERERETERESDSEKERERESKITGTNSVFCEHMKMVCACSDSSTTVSHQFYVRYCSKTPGNPISIIAG